MFVCTHTLGRCASVRARRGSWELEGTPPRAILLLSRQVTCANTPGCAINLTCNSEGERFERLAYGMTGVSHACFKNRCDVGHCHNGFTLVEVLVSLTIIAMAGSALLLATHAAMDSATDSLDQTIAQGIARQFLDEAMGLSYVEPGSDPFSLRLGPELGEDVDAGRSLSFDDTDDFDSDRIGPLVDPWGKPLGTGDGRGNVRHPNFQLRRDYFHDWEFTSRVVYVDEADPASSLPAGTVSGMRAIEVSVYKRQAQGNARLLANMRRVHSYVPSPQ